MQFALLSLLSLQTVEAFVPSPGSSRRRFVSPAFAKGEVGRIDDSNFASLLSDNRNVLVDAFTPWCGPCKLIEPVLEEGAQKWQDDVVVTKFNVQDNNPDFKVELLMQDNLPRALPSLLLFRDGKIVDSWKGAITSEEFNEFLGGHLSDKDSHSDSSGFVNLLQTEHDEYMLTR